MQGPGQLAPGMMITCYLLDGALTHIGLHLTTGKADSLVGTIYAPWILKSMDPCRSMDP